MDMKKDFCLIFLILLAGFQAFSHKSQKQKESLYIEPLTQKWLEFETLLKDEKTSAQEYLNGINAFYAEVEKARPSDTVLYYYPEAESIYNIIYIYSKELTALTKSRPLDSLQFQELYQKISPAIRDWEILQKNLAGFQLEQVYYSYRILIAVLFVLIILTLVFFVMYLLISKSREENKAFTVLLLKAQEAERERISNELHDTVCQDLRVLQFQLENKESISLCKKIASDVRNTCYALTPSDLNEGLLEALISLCALCRQRSGLNIILSIQEDIKKNTAFKYFSKDKNLNIYRIVQEILSNAVKHANAENISILIRSFSKTHFRIIISDDGKGFDLKSALKKKNHFGLKNIIARCENFSGEISVNSEKGLGTQITLNVPYK